jgi:hypothetical protein
MEEGLNPTISWAKGERKQRRTRSCKEANMQIQRNKLSRPVLDKKGGVWDVTFNSSERWSLRRAGSLTVLKATTNPLANRRYSA